MVSFIQPYLPDVLCNLTMDYVGAVNWFAENHCALEGLPTDIQTKIKTEVETSKKLDLRGTNVTWQDLHNISTDFKQLRYLDLRDCLNLQPEQWQVILQTFDHGEYQRIPGYQQLELAFPYHAALVVRLTDYLEIICRHSHVAEGTDSQRLEFIRQTSNPIISCCSNLSKERPADFDTDVLLPYLLENQCDLNDPTFVYKYSELNSCH